MDGVVGHDLNTASTDVVFVMDFNSLEVVGTVNPGGQPVKLGGQPRPHSFAAEQAAVLSSACSHASCS